MVYFELIIVTLTIASGIIALVDIVFFAQKRQQHLTPEQAKLSRKQRYVLAKPPIIADYARSLFWVFLVVLVVRSFIAQPYRIPSGSMLPNLKVGDFILVTQYNYGIRLPLWHSYVGSAKLPQRGDVVVLRYPVYPKINFIKRVIGLPGDAISYVNKQLIINGHTIPQTFVRNTIEPVNSPTRSIKQYHENLFGVQYDINKTPWQQAKDFYNLKVPAGEVFVMGDNRDDSEDSRFWGFAPVRDLVGKAQIVWFSWAGWPQIVRWNRIGTVVK